MTLPGLAGSVLDWASAKLGIPSPSRSRAMRAPEPGGTQVNVVACPGTWAMARMSAAVIAGSPKESGKYVLVPGS